MHEIKPGFLLLHENLTNLHEISGLNLPTYLWSFDFFFFSTDSAEMH